MANESEELDRIRKDLHDQRGIVEDDVYERIAKLLLNRVVEGGPGGLQAGDRITKSLLAQLPQE